MADADKTKLTESKEALVNHAVTFMESATKKSTIKEKLSSRKFWIAAVGCITGILGMIGLNDNIIALVAFAVLELGSIVGYCIAEGMIDAASFKKLLEIVSQIVDMIQDVDKPGTTEPVPPQQTPELPENTNKTESTDTTRNDI